MPFQRGHYHLYVVDDRGRSIVIRDSHNDNGNRTWILSEKEPFTIVLEHATMRTLLSVDEKGELAIETEEVKRPKPKSTRPKRRSRFWKPPEYRPGSR